MFPVFCGISGSTRTIEAMAQSASVVILRLSLGAPATLPRGSPASSSLHSVEDLTASPWLTLMASLPFTNSGR